MKTDRLWLAIIFGYFLLQALIRPLYGPALELDEAEAFWFSRHLAFGYGPQPPLYFWMQWAALQIIGPNLWALSVLKALLLAGSLALVFRFLRPALPPLGAAAAALSLGLLPEISWEAQRALTHTVLVLFLSVLAVVTFWRLLDRRTLASHALFGLVAGLGLIAKFNFALLLVSLVVAAMALPDLRARLRPGRLALSLGIALILPVPYLLWALHHPEIATGSLHKLALDDGGFIAVRLSGVASMAIAVGSLFAVALAVLALPLRTTWGSLPRPTGQVRYLAAVGLAALAVTLLLTLTAGMGQMRSRWIMPLTWPLVPAAIAWLWPGLAAKGRMALVALCAGAWAVVMAGLLAVTGSTYRVADIPTAAAALPADVPLVSDNLWLLGNLAFVQDGRDLRYLDTDPLPAPGSAMILATPKRLEKLATRIGAPTPDTIETLAVPDGQRLDSFEWARLPAPTHPKP